MFATETKPVSKAKKIKKPPVSSSLVYETIDGKPVYYNGYEAVLNNTKKLEDIMGSGTLQMILLQFFIRLLVKITDENEFYLGNNEIGLHLGKNDNLSSDLALFEKSKFTPDKIGKKYADFAPFLVVEVDTDAAFEDFSAPDYINIKTQKLLDFGVQKLIWVFTESKKVMVATPNHPWLIYDWGSEIEIFNGHTFNLAAYLQSEGIQL